MLPPAPKLESAGLLPRTLPNALPPNAPPNVDFPELRPPENDEVVPPRLANPLAAGVEEAGLDDAKEESVLPVAAPKGEAEPLLPAAAKGEAAELEKAPKPDFLNAVSEVCGRSLAGASVGFVGDFGAMDAKGDAAEVFENPLPKDF